MLDGNLLDGNFYPDCFFAFEWSTIIMCEEFSHLNGQLLMNDLLLL